MRFGWRLFLKGKIETEVFEGFFGQEQFVFYRVDFSFQVLSLYGDLLRQYFYLEFKSNGFGGGRLEELYVLGELDKGKFPLVNFDSALIKDQVKLFLVHFQSVLVVEGWV